MHTLRTLFVVGITLVAMSSPAFAHFPFLEWKPADDAGTLHVYFSELAEPDNPALLTKLVDSKVSQQTPGSEPKELAIQLQNDALTASPKTDGPTAFLLTKDYGTLERNGESYHLQYYAKTYSDPAAWKVETSKSLPLDLIPERKGNELTLTVLWKQKPVADAELVIQSGTEFLEAKSNAAGKLVYKIEEPGLYSIRVKHVEKDAEGKASRHYSTLTLDLKNAK
jgi:hypothetical protein